MEKKIFAAILMFIMAAGLFFGGYKAGAAGTGAGSVSDPLITKTYLDKRLSEAGVSGGSSYEKVTVGKGGTLKVQETCQLFMYSGAGTISGGSFVALGTGDVFVTGNIMVKYNLFFAVEGECSILCASGSVFYVNGEYIIE